MLSGGGGKGRRRPRALGEDREPLIVFLGLLYGSEELVADPGPRAIALSRSEASMLPPIGVNGNFSGRILAVALEIVYGAASAGKCVARASGVISCASTLKFRVEVIVLGRHERRQKRKPTTKASKTTTPTMMPAISPVFEGFDDDGSVVGWG